MLRVHTLFRLQHGEVDDDGHPGDEDASEDGITACVFREEGELFAA